MNKKTATSGKSIKAAYAYYVYVHIFLYKSVSSARVQFPVCWTGGLGFKGH